MDAQPQDNAARREELERWAEEQRQRHGRSRGLAARAVRAYRLVRAPRFADRALEGFGDRLLDRELHTSSRATQTREGVADLPSPWHVLPRALRYVRVSDEDTFVDFGCGRGRVVHQAAKRSFRRVIGVEISPALVDTARATLAAGLHRHRCQNVEIVLADARQFQVPDDLTIAYFFRPFGEDVLAPILGNIIESIDRRPRSVRLIYVWPLGNVRSTILDTGRFRLLTEQSASLLGRGHDRVAIFEGR